MLTIAYNTDDEFDEIKKYYVINRHYENIGIVQVNANDIILPSYRHTRARTTYRVDTTTTVMKPFITDQYRPMISYQDIHKAIGFSSAIDELTAQIPAHIPPCGDSNVIIVIDTGITRHEAFEQGFRIHLSSNIIIPSEATVEARSVVGDNGADDFEIYGHGTAVSYLARVFAPNADIISIKAIHKVGNEFQGTDEDILEALDLAIKIIDQERKGKHSMGVPYLVEIYNMSFGGEPTLTPTPVELAIQNISMRRPQAIFVGAAGNLGPKVGTIVNPSQSPWCIAVGSCNPSSFIVSPFSSRGPTRSYTKPEYLMPGENITAASRTGFNNYAIFSGTSFATPLLAGGLATAISGIIFVTPQVQNLIKQYENLKLDIKGIINNIGTRITVKPQVAGANLSGKDNNYGFGIPYGPLIAKEMGFMIQAIQSPSQLAAAQAISLANTTLSIGILGLFMNTLLRLV